MATSAQAITNNIHIVQEVVSFVKASLVQWWFRQVSSSPKSGVQVVAGKEDWVETASAIALGDCSPDSVLYWLQDTYYCRDGIGQNSW